MYLCRVTHNQINSNLIKSIMQVKPDNARYVCFGMVIEFIILIDSFWRKFARVYAKKLQRILGKSDGIYTRKHQCIKMLSIMIMNSLIILFCFVLFCFVKCSSVSHYWCNAFRYAVFVFCLFQHMCNWTINIHYNLPNNGVNQCMYTLSSCYQLQL